MTAYAGSALYLQWVHAGGTVTIHGDFRTCTYEPSVDLYDQTAGADANKSYLSGVKDGRASVSCVMQADGTALTNALKEGTEGTLTISPEGTASGNQKMSFAAISLGARFSMPYNDVVEFQCDFQQNGARTDAVH